MHSPPRLLLTGPPRVGKTSVVRRLIRELQSLGLRAGGFVTDEVCEKGRRVGFRAREIDGPSAIMAHVDSVIGPRLGRYRVLVPSFEGIALPAIDHALSDADVMLLDELGRMELFSEAFVARLNEVFRSAVPLVATVQLAANPITDALKRRSDVDLIMVTEANRDGLPASLAARLVRGRASGSPD
jgi:nucleoside-triphosphatase